MAGTVALMGCMGLGLAGVEQRLDPLALLGVEGADQLGVVGRAEGLGVAQGLVVGRRAYLFTGRG
jgi:hypothetical protein